MFEKLIHYLESGTDDVHGYVNELLDAEKTIKELEKDCEDYENTITEMTQKIAEMEDELAEALQENGVQHE